MIPNPIEEAAEMIFGKPLADLFKARGYKTVVTDEGLMVVDPSPTRPTHYYVQIHQPAPSDDE